MTKSDLENQLLRAFLDAVLQRASTTDELRGAAMIVRSSAFTDRLGILLETLAGQQAPEELKIRPSRPPSLPRAVERKGNGSLNSDEVFDLAKRRKINKNQLYDIFSRVDPGAVPPDSPDVTIREALRIYRTLVTDNDWSLLIAMIEGRDDIDPFLKGILKR